MPSTYEESSDTSSRVEEASACATRVSRCFERVTGAQLSLRDLDLHDNLMDLWTSVNHRRSAQSTFEATNDVTQGCREKGQGLPCPGARFYGRGPERFVGPSYPDNIGLHDVSVND